MTHISTPVRQNTNSIISRVSANDIVIGPTNGVETFTHAKSVFRYISPAFFNDPTMDKPSKATENEPVTVYKIKRDTTFAEMFGSMGYLNDLAFTQGQIIEFCRSHSDKLRPDGEATLFLFETEGKCFIADIRVRMHDNSFMPEVYMDYADNRNRWNTYSRPLLVIPAQRT